MTRKQGGIDNVGENGIYEALQPVERKRARCRWGLITMALSKSSLGGLLRYSQTSKEGFHRRREVCTSAAISAVRSSGRCSLSHSRRRFQTRVAFKRSEQQIQAVGLEQSESILLPYEHVECLSSDIRVFVIDRFK